MKVAVGLLLTLIYSVSAYAMSESAAREIATAAVCRELRDRGKPCSDLPPPEAVYEQGKWLFDFVISSTPEHRIGIIVHPDGAAEITEFDASKRDD